jgi:hypothetical protein
VSVCGWVRRVGWELAAPKHGGGQHTANTALEQHTDCMLCHIAAACKCKPWSDLYGTGHTVCHGVASGCLCPVCLMVL